MRLLLATDAVGGVWTYSVELAHALRPLGVETILATIGPQPSAGHLAEADGIRLVETDAPLDWLAESPREICRTGTELARIADDVRADVVQLPSAAYGANVAFDQPVVAVQHSCVATWWDAVRGGPLPRDFAWRAELVSAGLARASVVVAPTAAFAAQTARAYDFSRPILAVHNGRTPLSLSPREKSESVLTVGRLWDDAKNVHTLDRAASRVRTPVEAVGPLNGPNGATAAFKNLRTRGPLYGGEMATMLSARPIFGSSALYEPFGLSALEAAQARCALILSDIPTFRELWNGAAIFVAPDDDRGFADAIERLVDDPERRDQLGRAAQLRALDYTPASMAERMLQIYRQLAPAPARQVASAA